MSDAIRCKRCDSGTVDLATQRCLTCGRWWEPVTLIDGPTSFSCDALRAALARPMAATSAATMGPPTIDCARCGTRHYGQPVSACVLCGAPVAWPTIGGDRE